MRTRSKPDFPSSIDFLCIIFIKLLLKNYCHVKLSIIYFKRYISSCNSCYTIFRPI